MLLRSLRLTSVRNLAPLTLQPAPRFNVLYGDNGQGKTNLLEAIYAIGTLRSFRTQRLAELIAFGAEGAHLVASVMRDEMERVCEVTLRPRSRVVRLDGKAARPISKYFGQFNVVLFAPEDLQVPRGSPADRRRFLDRAVFNHSMTHLDQVRSYDRVLKNRNALLRNLEGQRRPSGPDAELLTVLDQQLAHWGARLIDARRRLLDAMRPRFQVAFESITRTGATTDVEYLTADELASAGSAAELEEGLQALLVQRRSVDIARSATTVGPHRDDLRFLFQDKSASAFASQGQLRALVLAWKTAELELLARIHGESPILLLDDVSSELDPDRNRYLFDFLRDRDSQCFITTTHPKHVLLTRDRVDYQVDSGVITRRNH